jgi:hypothetical protein
MSQSRKDVLSKALEAEVGGATVDLGTLFTDDVVGWSPLSSVSGLTALAELSALNVVAEMAGVTVADFREDKIRSFRTYFDDISLIEQLVDA